MAYVAVDKDGLECIYLYKPGRSNYNNWTDRNNEIRREDSGIDMPKGSIKKLIGRDLTWKDEPVELKEEIIMKEVKIQIPDNCELIKDGDTYIVREKKQIPPRSWEEFCKRYPIQKGEAYINLESQVKEFGYSKKLYDATT